MKKTFYSPIAEFARILFEKFFGVVGKTTAMTCSCMQKRLPSSVARLTYSQNLHFLKYDVQQSSVSVSPVMGDLSTDLKGNVLEKINHKLVPSCENKKITI
jgi:hypothetical protein